MAPPAAPDTTGTARAERWLPGEYAKCLHDAPWFRRALTPHRSGPAAGDVVKVRNVLVKRCPLSTKYVEMLTFDRWPRSAFPSASFRKAEKPKFTLRALRPRRDSHVAGVGAAAIVTALCYGAAAVAQLFGNDQ